MRNFLHCFGLLLLLVFQASAQDRQISGKVSDVSGSPLAGVTVTEKATKNATATQPDGSFTLSIKAGAVLVFTGVGYETKEMATGNLPVIDVQLANDVRALSEVVVTGVGVATNKRKVAIDVATVSSKDFARSATASIEQGIMGQIAGAQIQQTSGQPNSGFNIILRGVNALGGTSPMILLDGVEVQDLSDIDPATVDRVEVVKGAAAGMLYGAQGANGIIQIFSRRGIKGKVNIRASSRFSWDNILRGNELVASKHHYITDPQGYILDNNGQRIQPSAVGEWPDPQEDLSVDSKNDKPYLEPVYDHISQSFRQALTQTHSVSISGGAEKIDYAVTASYLGQQDVYSNTFKRLNLNLNLGLELFSGFTLRSNTQTVFSEDNTLADPDSRFGLINNFAFVDFLHRDSLGYLVNKPRNENQHNPLSEPEWHQNSVKPLRLVQNIDVNYKFPKFVSLNYKFGIDRTSSEGLDYYLNQTGSLQGGELPWGNNPKGSILKYTDKQTLVNSLASIFINTDFEADFHLKIPLKTVTQVAYDYRRDDHFFHGSQGLGLPTYPPYTINSAESTIGSDNPLTFFAPPVFVPGTFVTYGLLVNQSFDYGTLFGISGGLRSDYSSEFGAASKPFTFFRGTGYLTLSELLRSNVISAWKLRGAYGEAGIQPGRYQRQVTLQVNQIGTAGVGLSLPTISQNPNLQVQVSKELELGTDITLRPNSSAWFSRIFFSGTYWRRKSERIIQDADVAISTGFATKTDNLTTISSRGLDLTLDATIFDSPDFTWNFGYRMGFTRSMVDKISNGQDVIAGPFSLKEGKEVGQLYGQYVIRDINQLRPDGTPYIEDGDKGNFTSVDGVIVDMRSNQPILSDPDDLTGFGSVYPDFTASFINTFTIKRSLNVSVQFDWYEGNKIYNMSRHWLYRDRIAKDFDRQVTIGNKTGAFVNYYAGFYNTISPDDWFVEDGSFLRLRNLSISYDFAPLLKTKWFSNAELILSGRNLLTFTDYSGLDPENTSNVDNQGNDVSTQVGGFKGIDYFGVPNTRSFQVGVSLGF